MKKVILQLCFPLLACLGIVAQTPQSIPYQAVARDAGGNLLQNQPVSLLFTINDVTSNGTVLYQEHQSATSNNLGLFTVSIGNGSPVTGTFSAIPWSNGNAKFIDIKIDPSHGLNGSNYTDLGSSQMLSVPYVEAPMKLTT